MSQHIQNLSQTIFNMNTRPVETLLSSKEFSVQDMKYDTSPSLLHLIYISSDIDLKKCLTIIGDFCKSYIIEDYIKGEVIIDYDNFCVTKIFYGPSLNKYTITARRVQNTDKFVLRGLWSGAGATRFETWFLNLHKHLMETFGEKVEGNFEFINCRLIDWEIHERIRLNELNGDEGY